MFQTISLFGYLCLTRLDGVLTLPGFSLQWETSLNQLGELEFLVRQSSGEEPTTVSTYIEKSQTKYFLKLLGRFKELIIYFSVMRSV